MELKLTLVDLLDFKFTWSALGKHIDIYSSITLTLSALCCAICWCIVKQLSFPNPQHIRCIYTDDPISYWYHAFKYAIASGSTLARVRETYSSTIKIPTLSGWLVLTSNAASIEALRKIPEMIPVAAQAPSVSSREDLSSIFGTFSKDKDVVDEYRNFLAEHAVLATRSLGALLAGLQEDITTYLQTVASEGRGNGDACDVNITDLVLPIVARAVDKGLFGQEICTTGEYAQICTSADLLVKICISSKLLGRLSRRLFLMYYAPCLHRLILSMPSQRLDHAKDSPMLAYLRTVFDSDTKKFSLKSQLITVRALLTLRIYAVQKLCQSMIQVIEQLSTTFASNPAVTRQMAEEVTAGVRTHGWSSEGLQSMPLVDSFIKESIRLERTGRFATHLTFPRWVRLPGIKGRIPGQIPIAIPIDFVHLDPRRYPSPRLFMPTRFMDFRDPAVSDLSSALNPKYRLETTSVDFLAWNHGVNACPGRFFASAVMKLVLATVVENWEVHRAEEISGVKSWIRTRPKGKAIVLRKRTSGLPMHL